MGYYWYLELEENGLFKKKLWGKDNLSRLPGNTGCAENSPVTGLA